MYKPANVTATGIAVALAVIVVVGLLFFGPEIFGLFNHSASQTQTTMTEQQNNQSVPAQNSLAPQGAPTADQAAQLNSVTQLEGKDLVVGTGAEAQNGDQVTVQYVGQLTNGTTFDASANHGTQGFTFTLGAGQVIKGWDEGVIGMKVGGTRELVIPASLGYGAQAVGPIPANSVLVFQVQLLKVVPPSEATQ